MTGFGGKTAKNAPICKYANMAFFGKLRANRSTFCSFTAKTMKIKWELKFMSLLLLPVHWVLAWKIVEFFGLLSFFENVKKKPGVMFFVIPCRIRKDFFRLEMDRRQHVNCIHPKRFEIDGSFFSYKKLGKLVTFLVDLMSLS